MKSWSNKRRNSSYNHWYGVCCYETGDLTGAEKHLKVAVKRKVQEAYRYMSEVYYKTYRFDEAGEMLEEYINLLAKKKAGSAIVRNQARLGKQCTTHDGKGGRCSDHR